MPLIIAVLIIIVIVLNAKDANKNNAKLSAIREKDRRKTNAELEQATLDKYMKHGYSFDESFKMAYDDMIKAGFDPCIPRSAYTKNRYNIQSSYCENPRKYDSWWVKQRRSYAEEQWKRSHPGVFIGEASPDEIDALTYDSFPSTSGEYLHDIKRVSAKSKAEPIGTFIIYPGLGTCEILAHNWIGDGSLGGTYTLKVLKTGKVVTHVKIGDKKITKQGR